MAKAMQSEMPPLEGGRWQTTGGMPYAPLLVYRVAESARAFIGMGSFVALAIGALITGAIHIALVWRLLFFVGLSGAVVFGVWALVRMSVRPRKRYLRSLVLAFAVEIDNQVQIVHEAVAQGVYWNVRQRELPTDAWPKHLELAAEPALADVFFAMAAAYRHANRLNWVAQQRTLEGVLAIEDVSQDGLDRALNHMGTAYKALRESAEAIGP